MVLHIYYKFHPFQSAWWCHWSSLCDEEGWFGYGEEGESGHSGKHYQITTYTKRKAQKK